MSEDWHSVTLKIPFASEKHALIAKRTIEVDPELQPHAVKRVITVEENVLIAAFSTLTIRLARLVANAFLENVDLVVRTLEQFSEEAENPPYA
ncbi:CTAG/Pcc1 family [Lentinula aff. lateritia]|uniref:CTAG/Pcc1 family n=1 Tax=Lentinula aff. lateritia TaxID=2804960 RepID=A0ACC1TVF3_9AGAR|nr:CTAG/Pcc1 family [Lentinula aff. lateritia]